MTNVVDFVQAIEGPGFRNLDRACAILWWIGQDDAAAGLTTAEICGIIEDAGHPKQNSLVWMSS